MALFVAVAFMSGCSNVTRHDVLTFFFTGVPEPGAEGADGAGVAGRQVATLAPGARQRPKLKLFREPRVYVHGPYGSGQCELCHATAASKPFRTLKGGVTESTVSRAKSIGPRLAYPLEELCVTCHSEKSAEAAGSMDLAQHKPVADGWCTACHSPHKALRQYMLLKNNNVELCIQCHKPDELQASIEHRKDPEADCISCHNPHVGKSPLLLKAEYDEWSIFDDL